MKLPQQSAGSAARDCCANINIEFPIKGARKPKKKMELKRSYKGVCYKYYLKIVGGSKNHYFGITFYNI